MLTNEFFTTLMNMHIRWEKAEGSEGVYNGVELAWKILDPILDFWAEENTQPEGYASGSWGPQSGITMLARDGFVWRRP